MPRTEARIFTSIWKDPDFLSLGPGPQRLYMFLLSQDDLTYCGVMPLRERRWAAMAAGLSRDEIERDIKELEAACRQFVICDTATEELLIRSFMRNDEVWKQPNLMKAARTAGTQVQSAAIRDALLAELYRIPAAGSSSKLVREVHAAFVKDLANPSGNPSDNPKANPGPADSLPEGAGQEGARNPSPNPSANPSAKAPAKGSADRSAKPSPNPAQERGVSNGSNHRDLPTPELLPSGDDGNPSPNPSANPSGNPSTAGELIADWLEHVASRPPKSVIDRVGKHVKDMLAEHIDPGDIRRGLAAWARKGLDPSVLPGVVNQVMNASPNAGGHVPYTNPADDADYDRKYGQ